MQKFRPQFVVIALVAAAVSSTCTSTFAQNPYQLKGFPGAIEAAKRPFDGSPPIAGMASNLALNIRWEVITFFSSHRNDLKTWTARRTLGNKINGQISEQYTDTERCPGLEKLLQKISPGSGSTMFQAVQIPNVIPPIGMITDIPAYDVWVSDVSQLPQSAPILQPQLINWVPQILNVLRPCWKPQ